MKDKNKNVVKSNNNKNKKRLSDVQLLRITLIAAIFIMLGFIAFAFRGSIKSLFPKKAPTDWNQVDPDGTVEVDPNAVEEEKDTYVDKDGLPYTRKKIYSLGISAYIPDGWTLNSNSDGIYLTTTDPAYKGVELHIATKQIDEVQIENLPSNMTAYIERNFRYHFQGVTFSAVPTYSIQEQAPTYLVSDPNVLVWVPSTGLKYEEFATRDDIPAERRTEPFNQTAKFKYVWQTGTMEMSEETSNRAKANPYYCFGYTFLDDIEYFVSTVAPKDYYERCETVLNAVMMSIKEIDQGNIRLPSFSNAAEFKDITFKLPKSFEQRAVNYSTSTKYVATNWKSDDYGYGVTVTQLDFEEEDLITFNLYDDIRFRREMFAAYTCGETYSLLNMNIEDIILGFDAGEQLMIDGHQAYKYNTNMWLYTDGTELQVKTTQTLPVYGVTYLIEDGRYMYIVNLTYTGKGGQPAAEKYARALSKTIHFH